MEYLNTKEQAIQFLHAIECKEPLPTNSKILYINRPLIYGGLITIQKSKQKSTYNKTLWSIHIEQVG